MITVYGIKNCETMKKAFAWFERNKVAYAFHDYKKEGADEHILSRAIRAHGWENVLNRKGTSWRKLPEKARRQMDAKKALDAALGNPSLVRRPMVVRGGEIHFGFDEAEYKRMFSKG